MKINPLKGMKDYLPEEMRLRDYVQGKILEVYRASGFERISTPQPMRSDAKSKFVWYHISTCGKGTEIYAETYASFDELREAVRLSKEDVIKKLM